jgi:virginiamycin B lyase
MANGDRSMTQARGGMVRMAQSRCIGTHSRAVVWRVALAAALTMVLLAAGRTPTAALHASAAVAGKSAPGPYLYWANGGGPTVGRAWLDGSHVNNSFINDGESQEALCGVAIAGKYIYWGVVAGSPPNPIGRAKLDGTGVDHTFLTTDPNPACGVAVEGGHIYWASYNGGFIGRANLDGTGVNDTFITGIGIPNVACDNGDCSPIGIAVDSAHIYWGEIGSIGRANLDGTGVNQHFITGLTIATGVAVSSKYIYWTDQGATAQQAGHIIPSELGRARLDGTGVQRGFIKGLNGGCGVGITDRYIFWTQCGPGGSGTGTTIGRANLDGTGVRQSFISGLQAPQGVTVGP